MNKTLEGNFSFNLTEEQIDKVLSTLNLPACPTTVNKALEESRKEQPNLRILSDLIASDPGMSAATLKLVNSALYKLSNKITSIHKAVERLGTNVVLFIVVSFALKELGKGLPQVWLEKFWEKTTQLAIATSIIAKKQFCICPESTYIYALFHDAAIPILMKKFNDYDKVIKEYANEGKLIVEAESKYFPCTHPVVGALLLKNWGLPSNLGLAVRFHHEKGLYEMSGGSIPSSAISLIAVTQVAEHLLNELMNEFDSEVGIETFELAVKFLGLSETDLEDYRELIIKAFNF